MDRQSILTWTLAAAVAWGAPAGGLAKGKKPGADACTKTGTERRVVKDQKTKKTYECTFDVCTKSVCSIEGSGGPKCRNVTSYTNSRDCEEVAGSGAAPRWQLQTRPGTPKTLRR